MSQLLLTVGFFELHFSNEQELLQKIMKTKDDYIFGYLVECDVQYPPKKTQKWKDFQISSGEKDLKAKGFS